MSKILSKQREQRNSNRRQPKQAQKVLEQNSRIISAKNKSRKKFVMFYLKGDLTQENWMQTRFNFGKKSLMNRYLQTLTSRIGKE